MGFGTVLPRSELFWLDLGGATVSEIQEVV
jgi:hypothetical protein